MLDTQKIESHTLSVLVDDEPGVLAVPRAPVGHLQEKARVRSATAGTKGHNAC